MTTTEQQLTLTGGGPSAPTRVEKPAARTWRCGVLCPKCGPSNFWYVGQALWECEHCKGQRCENVWGKPLPVPEWRTQ